jgi:hypothetical protein
MTETQDIPSQESGSTEEFRNIVRRIPHIEDPVDLMDAISAALTLMLRREAERGLLDAFSVTVGEIIASLPLDGTEKELRVATRQAAHTCLTILKEARAARKSWYEESEALEEDMDAVLIDEMLEASSDYEETLDAERAAEGDGNAPAQTDEDKKENDDIEYFLPPELAHLLTHLEYEIPQPERIERKFIDFDDWFHAAILCRINRVLTFFQRHNPQITRELPPPFLL